MNTSNSREAHIKEHKLMARALIFAFAYVLAMIISYVIFDRHFSQPGQVENEYPLIFGCISSLLLMVAVYGMFVSVSHRYPLSFIIYMFISMLIVIRLLFPQTIFETDLLIKARVFSAYPSLCPITNVSNGDSAICYEYWYNGLREALIIDKQDVIGAPFGVKYPAWNSTNQESFNNVITGHHVEAETISRRSHDCDYADIQRAVGNIYMWSNAACWRAGK